MTTFLIILGIVWMLGIIFNCYFYWREEKDRIKRNGYIIVTPGDILMVILAIVIAPIVAAVFLKVVLDEDRELFRINMRRK